jgi:hypothetical protein
LCKRLAVPSGRGETLGEEPGITAISSVSLGAIVCKSRMLWRRVESDVTQSRLKKRINNFEGLNGAVEVLVIDSVFIVPHSGSWSCDLVTNEENAVISWIRFSLVYNSAGPGHDGRLLPHGRANGVKTEIGRATSHVVLMVRSVVIHVALSGMTLAPDAFVGDDVIRFGKIGRPRILRWDQITRLHQNSVRCYVMTMAAVVVRGVT